MPEKKKRRRGERPSYAYMSRRGLGTLHGLIVDAWRTLHMLDTMALADIRTAAPEAARNLKDALRLIEKKQGPLS